METKQKEDDYGSWNRDVDRSEIPGTRQWVGRIRKRMLKRMIDSNMSCEYSGS